jgi:hypothetical protein
VRRSWLATTAFLLVPPSADAEQFAYGVQSDAFWTDNVFGTAEDEVDDTSGRLSTWADLSDRDGNLTWGLRYAPAYEYYLDQSELRGFDHDVGGRFAWRLGPRTTLRLSDRFQRYNSVTRFNEQAEPGEDVVVVGQRERLKRNLLNASLDQLLGPRDLVSLSVLYSLNDFSGENQADSNFVSTGLLYQHQLSARTSIGSRFSWSRQTVERLEVDDSTTDYFNLSGVLLYEFSRTLSLELSAGPALIQGNPQESDPPTQLNVARFPLRQGADGVHFLDADSCKEDKQGNFIAGADCNSIDPALTQAQLNALNFSTGGNRLIVPFVGTVPSADDSTTTYFADVSLTKNWERWSGTLSYSRSENQSTVIAAVSDIVSGSLRWQIASRWSAGVSASFERREQAAENFVLATAVTNQPSPLPAFPSAAEAQSVLVVRVPRDVGVDFVRLDLRAAHQLTRRCQVEATIRWREQSQTGDVALLETTTRFIFGIGLRYAFDPIRF